MKNKSQVMQVIKQNFNHVSQSAFSNKNHPSKCDTTINMLLKAKCLVNKTQMSQKKVRLKLRLYVLFHKIPTVYLIQEEH